MSSNFRSLLVSLFLLVGVAVPWTVTAQAPISHVTSSVEDRVIQLERIYSAHSQLLTQFQQQLADNQRDTDLLRGQIQENQYQLSQVVEKQKQTYLKINSLTRQVQSPFSDYKRGEKNTDSPSCSGDENTDYNKAVVLMLEKKQYEQAISAFQSFVKHYPHSTYQPNAYYWLGQLNYNQNNTNDAAYYFALVVKKYPTSLKAPDALFKVGIIMQKKGQKDKARTVYQQVGKLYPNTNVAKQAQKRLSGL